MDVPRLEAFLEVARLGSMRAASRSLHVGQPALSARISRLEAELGARVFERTKRGVRLTSAGQALLPHAERVLESVAAGRTAVGQVEQGDEGELIIAAASAINASLVPELVARFRRFHPGVHLFVRTGSADRVADLVAFGTAQLGLVRDESDPHDPRLRATPLYAEQLLLTARPDHPFVGQSPIRLTRLADATLILFDRASDDYELVRALLREAGVSPYGVIEVDSVDTARRLVARGLGIAWLPSTAAVPEVEAGHLTSVQLVDAPALERRVVALERAEATSWIPVRTMRQLLADVPSFLPGATALTIEAMAGS
ncbi:MAG TPA: LysR family transcriptional regulator [Candidatus Deferrimicrobium sp.]|nr:LysR family transcriptional regulator [Candidatus Deferrimicrobium sp.]